MTPLEEQLAGFVQPSPAQVAILLYTRIGFLSYETLVRYMGRLGPHAAKVIFLEIARRESLEA